MAAAWPRAVCGGGLPLRCCEWTECKKDVQHTDSGSRSLHGYMSLAPPCCGEGHWPQHGPGQSVEMGCTCAAVSLEGAGNPASTWNQGPGLCTAACLWHYHAVVGAMAAAWPRTAFGDGLPVLCRAHITHCRQILLHEFKHHACAQQHDAGPPCCNEEGLLQQGS